MRRYALLFSILLPYSFFFCSATNISQRKAWEIVKTHILFGDTTKVNVFISNNTYDPNSSISVYVRNEKSPEFSSWFLFIDDSPQDSWNHPCRYVFVNAENGDYIIRNYTRPPMLDNMTTLVRQTDGSTIKSHRGMKNRTISSYAQNSATNDYAVIISGGINLENNKPRYWNDCSAMYSTLVNVYGYQKNHIYVIMADGTNPANDMMIGETEVSQQLDLDGDGTNDIQYAATKQNIGSVFNLLHNQISNSDNLLVFVTDHGGYDEVGCYSYMYLWGSEVMTSAEFATEVNKVNAANINICLGQCYSGGFISDLQASGRVITTACRYDEVSWGNVNYDTFLYQWISALAGESIDYGAPVNADVDSDGIISMKEAFDYASEHDQCAPQNNSINVEHPQYSSSPFILGRTLSLHNSFRGSYYNGISNHDINTSYPLYTNNGGYVEIWSPNIKDATVTYQGTSPASWLCNTITGYLKIVFPSTGGTIVVKIQRNGVEYDLIVVATISPYML